MIHDENKGSWCVQTKARWIHRQATPQRCFFIECSTSEERGVVSRKLDYGVTGKHVCVGVFISIALALLQIYFPLSPPDFLGENYHRIQMDIKNFWGALSLVSAVSSVVMWRDWRKRNIRRRRISTSLHPRRERRWGLPVVPVLGLLPISFYNHGPHKSLNPKRK